MQLTIKNNIFTLLAQKAIWWEIENTLIISDLHIGKISHFRNSGIAVPLEAANENFKRLNEIMTSYPVKKIVFTGDLFHSKINKEWESFCEWRKKHSEVDMLLVLGNHDRFPTSHYTDNCMNVYKDELSINEFIFTHHPRTEFKENEYIISGHVHPVVKLNGLGKQQLKFPCFYFGIQQAILPSFGVFTGGFVIDIKEEDQVIAIVKDTLILI